MCLEQAIGLFQRQVIEVVGIQSHADDNLADADQFRQCRLAERDGQLATTEQYNNFIRCLGKTVVYKEHTPESYYYYGIPQQALPVESYCGLTVFAPKESLPKMFEWYKQRVGWYKAVYE